MRHAGRILVFLACGMAGCSPPVTQPATGAHVAPASVASRSEPQPVRVQFLGSYSEPRLFVLDGGRMLTVTAFDSRAEGDATPACVRGNRTGLKYPVAVAIDEAHGEIFVADGERGAIVVHASSAQGNVAPLRVLGGPVSGIKAPSTIAMDARRGELFVTDLSTGDVRVYARDAVGDAPPLRVFRSGLELHQRVAFDSRHDTVLLGDGSSVATFSRSASGAATPLRTFSSVNVSARAIAVDGKNDEVVVIDAFHLGAILSFRGRSRGVVDPVRFLSHEGLFDLADLLVDPVHDEILAVDQNSASVVAFPRKADGHVVAVRTIRGDATTLNFPTGIDYDAKADEIVVANAGGSSLLRFGRANGGNAVPRGVIEGPSCEGENFTSLALDEGKGELFVGCGNHVLTLGVTGDDPVRKLYTAGSVDGLVFNHRPSKARRFWSDRMSLISSNRAMPRSASAKCSSTDRPSISRSICALGSSKNWFKYTRRTNTLRSPRGLERQPPADPDAKLSPVNALDTILDRAPEILAMAAAHGARNGRVVGSVARRTERADSDVDLLVRFDPGVGLLEHAKLVIEIEALLGRRVASPASAAFGRRPVGCSTQTRDRCEERPRATRRRRGGDRPMPRAGGSRTRTVHASGRARSLQLRNAQSRQVGWGQAGFDRGL